jgi:hypothetical protein
MKGVLNQTGLAAAERTAETRRQLMGAKPPAQTGQAAESLVEPGRRKLLTKKRWQRQASDQTCRKKIRAGKRGSTEASEGASKAAEKGRNQERLAGAAERKHAMCTETQVIRQG